MAFDLGLEVAGRQVAVNLGRDARILGADDTLHRREIGGYSMLDVPKRYAKPRPRLRFPGGSFKVP